MRLEYKRLDRKIVHKAHTFEFYNDTVQLPDGRVSHYDFLKHKGAAAVVPVLPDGKILMVRQFRNALDRVTLEIPAGGRNSLEEPFLETAYRELEEETGYRSENLVHLITICTAVAFCNEVIEIYVADDLIKSEQNLDEDEFIDVKGYELSELVQMIYDGIIQDSKTISAIMAYKDKYHTK